MNNYELSTLIRKEDYRVFNRELAHLIGLKESIYLMYLIDCDRYINKEYVGEPFFKQQRYIYLETTISEQTQKKINKTLKNLELIEIEKRGHPSKNYYKINYINVIEMIEKAKENHRLLSIEIKSVNDKNNTTSTIKNNSQINNNKEIINNTINTNVLIGVDQNDGIIESIDYSPDSISIANTLTSDATIESIEYSVGKSIDEVTPLFPDNRHYYPLPDEAYNKPAKLIDLMDHTREIIDKDVYPDILVKLDIYLRCHLGCRKLPSLLKWDEQLHNLIRYASIELPGSFGSKFMKNNAIAIIDKAIMGKDGVPFLVFDDIYKTGESTVSGPDFNLNQSFSNDSKKGY